MRLRNQLRSGRAICLTYSGGMSAAFGPGIESGWGENFPPVQTGPGAHSASCTMGTGSFSGVKYSWGVLLTTHPLRVSWSWRSRAIRLPTLWAKTGPVTGTLYLFFMSVALFIHYSNLMYRILLPCVACPVVPYFSTLGSSS